MFIVLVFLLRVKYLGLLVLFSFWLIILGYLVFMFWWVSSNGMFGRLK